MELTKNNIVNWINKRVVSYRVSWDDIVDYLDMAIDEINSYMSTKYPHVSSVLNEYAPTEKTYSFRAGGIDVEFFPGKYFTSIVMPYAITQMLTTDEEFTMIYSKYMSQYQENLFIMARDEMNNIPYQFISAPKGVYFANPDPQFKQNPEKYFNQQIVMDIPKIRISYSWGNYKSMIPFGIQTFVEKPLPKDPNAYESGFQYMPVMMSGENFSTYIVDYTQRVLGVFLGWSLKDDNKAEGIIQNAINIFEDTTFYAVFDLDIVGIEYNGNGGTVHNWRPTYVTKSEFNSTSLTPMGGTAFKKGYRFVGFELERVSNYTTEDEYDGFEEANDTTSEPGAVFKALWYKMIYQLTFIGAKGTFNPSKRNYTFGEEFNLTLPIQSESDPDEFIGWWDNPQFLGDRVTKIHESDYGDKTFYAKYNEEKYRVRWLAEDNSIIKEDFLTRGTFLIEPTGMVKSDAWISGLLYRFEHLGFINEYNEFFQPGITKAQRNANLKVVFSQPIPIEKHLVIYYKAKENETIVDKQIFINKQVGSEIDVDVDIIQYLTNEGLNTYEDLLSVQQFVKSVSFIINNNVSQEEMTSGMTFVMSEEEDYKVSCNYNETSWTITFVNKFLHEGNYVVGTDEVMHKFADNTSKVVVENKGASLPNILFKVTLDNLDEEYLQGFKVLGENNSESDVPSNIESDLTLVPYYGPTKNPAFIKTITFVGMPDKNSLTQKVNIIEEHKIGTVIDLLALKELTETNEYKYMKISAFFADSFDGTLTNQILTNTITLNNDRMIYIQTTNKKLYSIRYKNYSQTGVFTNPDPKVIDLYPIHFINGEMNFNTKISEPQITSYLGARYVLTGWSLTDGGVVNELNVTLLEERGEDFNLYPIFIRLGDFIVNYSFITLDSTPLLTDYTLQSTRMTSNKKKIDYEEYKNVIGSNKELFGSYNSLVQELNSLSPLLNNNEIQPQQIGYKLHSYKVNNGTAVQSTNIIVPIPQRAEVEGKDAEIDLEIILTRDENYLHVKIGDSSKPNDSLGSVDVNFLTGTVQHQRSKFVNKQVTFGQLISSGEIPSLSPLNGQALYYCYWNNSNPLAITDINYGVAPLGDISIYIKDIVEGLHQFKIIFRESNGLGGFTTLKTMHIYENQLVQYGSVWIFDINAYKPTNPSKYGYIFKGYSSPASNGAVVINYGIGTSNIQDIYFTAVYTAFGYINVNFKVKAETGDLLTDYDLSGDLSWSDMESFLYQKQFTFAQRTLHVYNMNALIEDFKNAIDYNVRAQMGYDVVGYRVDYNDAINSNGITYYEIFGPNPYIELTNILDSSIDNKNVNINFTFILRRKVGFLFVEVLEHSLPGETISHDAGIFRRFFMSWGEYLSTVRIDFQNNYTHNPIPILENEPYFRHDMPSGYIETGDSFQATQYMVQNIQLFIRDDN